MALCECRRESSTQTKKKKALNKTPKQEISNLKTKTINTKRDTKDDISYCQLDNEEAKSFSEDSDVIVPRKTRKPGGTQTSETLMCFFKQENKFAALTDPCPNQNPLLNSVPNPMQNFSAPGYNRPPKMSANVCKMSCLELNQIVPAPRCLFNSGPKRRPLETREEGIVCYPTVYRAVVVEVDDYYTEEQLILVRAHNRKKDCTIL